MRQYLMLVAMFAIGTPVTVLAEPPKVADSKEELKLLQGKWQTKKVVADGEEVPADQLAKEEHKIVIDGDHFEGWSKGKVGIRLIFSVNAATSPKQVLLYEADAKWNKRKVAVAGAAKEVDKSPMKGLYELKGNKLTICWGGSDDFPAKLKAGPDVMFFELERAK